MARTRKTAGMRISKDQARRFRSRWKAVNAAERKELQSTPMSTKLRQLESLARAVEPLGWSRALKEEESAVRRRWNKLRRVLNARK